MPFFIASSATAVIVANTKAYALPNNFYDFFKFLGNIAQNLYSAVRRGLIDFFYNYVIGIFPSRASYPLNIFNIYYPCNTFSLYSWASEASPTLGCSIEISRDI